MFNKELLKELEIFHMKKTRLVEDMCLFSNIIEICKEERHCVCFISPEVKAILE